MSGMNNVVCFHFSMAAASVATAGSENTAATTETPTAATPSTYQSSESVPSSSR
jgi:hypothetical protein